jgi:hypothetical protein
MKDERAAEYPPGPAQATMAPQQKKEMAAQPPPPASPAKDKKQKNNRMEAIIAVAIALVTVTAAVVVWRASIVLSNASDADREGIINTTKAEAALAEDVRFLYQEAVYAVKYDLYQVQIDYLQGQAPRLKSAGDAAGGLAAEAEARWLGEAAKGLKDFSPLTKNDRYRTTSGAFNLEKRLDDLRAENKDLRDLSPDSDFHRADRLYNEAELLIVTVSVLSVSLFFYTLAQITRRRIRVLFALGGLGVFLIALLAVASVEVYFNLIAA